MNSGDKTSARRTRELLLVSIRTTPVAHLASKLEFCFFSDVHKRCWKNPKEVCGLSMSTYRGSCHVRGKNRLKQIHIG
ncbi:unnamed protein product [Allacma fusca]|uniref:Kazal-like domain-containing protein n=1 Tax=Allacma fusca TaxID=39272 RepID=A0A8J2J9D6_9HEXA|nr:unnamed protein product [Allacma fusca]